MRTQGDSAFVGTARIRGCCYVPAGVIAATRVLWCTTWLAHRKRTRWVDKNRLLRAIIVPGAADPILQTCRLG